VTFRLGPVTLNLLKQLKMAENVIIVCLHKYRLETHFTINRSSYEGGEYVLLKKIKILQVENHTSLCKHTYRSIGIQNAETGFIRS
jgi:hypothetical protein